MLLEDQGRGPWDTSGPRIVLPCEALFRVAPPPPFELNPSGGNGRRLQAASPSSTCSGGSPIGRIAEIFSGGVYEEVQVSHVRIFLAPDNAGGHLVKLAGIS